MKQKNVDQVKAVDMLPGIARRTLAYNDHVMLCHFTFKAGAKIPLHQHAPSQIGFVIRGRVRFVGATEDDAFEVGPGDSYVVDPNVQHGAEVIEDAVLVEIFSPARDEYK